MKTEICSVDFDLPLEEQLAKAATLIREGHLVAFPTETVYGLGANALDPKACDSIFEAKGRPHDNPLIVHVLNPEDISEYAENEDNGLFRALADAFMPGPLTVILPKKKIIPDEVTVGLGTVAIRCPSHPVARALIKTAGAPIAAPSANLSGKPSPTCVAHVIRDMDGRIPMIIDGGSAQVGLESTVIALTGNTVRLLRPGFVTVSDLMKICPNVKVSPSVLAKLSSEEKAESPGMKYRHYAPSAPITMVRGEEGSVLAFFRKKHQEGYGILCFEEDLPFFDETDEKIIAFGKKDDLLSQANGLFDALRAFDDLSVPAIYARHTSQDDLGLAISNRLLRACSFEEINL